ncbi:MAG TPA: NAD(P)H-dependent oxidoreductase subunit E, partial [Dermatophilaceae bacterium]|nr:NAD(P)H-dependent oxidoreductase subunit E [Dermatophilaceae bacterium]
METIDAHAALRGPLLPVLHALQKTFGYVDSRAVPLVATALNVSRADVYGVLTFYPDLRSALPGTVRVQVCRGEACQSVGAHALAEHATGSLGV